MHMHAFGWDDTNRYVISTCAVIATKRHNTAGMVALRRIVLCTNRGTCGRAVACGRGLVLLLTPTGGGLLYCSCSIGATYQASLQLTCTLYITRTITPPHQRRGISEPIPGGGGAHNERGSFSGGSRRDYYSRHLRSPRCCR